MAPITVLPGKTVSPQQLAQAQAAANAAEAANVQWKWSNSPEGVAYYQNLRAQQEQQKLQEQKLGDEDARKEQLKHDIAFHPETIFGAPGTGTMQEMYAKFGPELGRKAMEYSTEYYREHPSERAQELTKQYASTVGLVVTGEGSTYRQGEMVPYDPSGDVGVTGRAARQYGAGGMVGGDTYLMGEKSWSKTPAPTPIKQSVYYMPVEQLVPKTETVPFRTEGEMQTMGGRTFYVPYGERTQQELLDAKGTFDPIGGRIGIYQKPPSIYEVPGGFKRIYGWEVAGGSTGALQSGMFSIDRALTPDIRTQWAPGNYAPSANIVEAMMIRAEPSKYSRLGAEAYGGKVTLLDQRTLKPGQLMGRYPEESGNLANLVDPFGVNRPKQELLATEPWSIDWATAPVLQTMKGSGFAGTTVSPLAAPEYAKVGLAAPEAKASIQGKEIAPGIFLTGEVTVAGKGGVGVSQGSTGPATMVSELPKPYISESTGIAKPKGDVFGYQIPGISPVVAFFEPEQKVTTSISKIQIPEVTKLKATETTTDAMTGTTTIKDTWETTGGEKSLARTVTAPVAGSSGYDRMNQAIREFLHLPSVEIGETAMRKASYLTDPTGLGVVRMTADVMAGLSEKTFGKESPITKQAKESAEFQWTMSPFSGQYKMFYEQPALTGLSYAAGVLFGGAATTYERGAMAVRGATAEKIISEGGAWRAAEQYHAFVMRYGPRVLEGMYALDVAGRSTKGFTTFEPGEVLPRAHGIAVQETYPMMEGFALPERIITGVSTMKIAYRAAQQEIAGERAAAYIQPVSPESVSMRDVLTYKISPKISEMKAAAMEPFTREVVPEIQRPAMAPEMEYGTSYVYEKTPVRDRLTDIAERAKVGAQETVAAVKGRYEGIRGDYYQYLVENAPAPLTPREKIDTGLLQLQEKTGYLQPERLQVYSKQTGELIYESKGSLYDTETGRWMSDVKFRHGEVQEAMRARGIEPLTMESGSKLATPDYSEIAVYHTHTQGLTPAEKLPRLELPSSRDIKTTVFQGFGESGVVTPSGVIRMSPKGIPEEEALFGSVKMAKVAYAETGSKEVTGKVFAESMKRAGAGEYEYFTRAEIEAGLPGAQRETGFLDYLGSKIPSGKAIRPEYQRPAMAPEMEFGTGYVYGTKPVKTRLAEMFGQEPRAPEIQRPAMAPEEEFAFQYQRTTLAEKHESLVDWMYKPRLSKIIPPSTWGETRPLLAIAGPAVTEGGRATTRTGGAPEGGRMGTKVVGGRTVRSLAPESSLRSEGFRDVLEPESMKGTRTGFARQRSVDFRGRPASETMKPMRPETYGFREGTVKQAAGMESLILTETLPVVEGMPAAAVRGTEQPLRMFAGVMAPQARRIESVQVIEPEMEIMRVQRVRQGEAIQRQRRGMVSVIEPSLEFAQASRARQEQMVAPAALTARARSMASLTGVLQTDVRVSQEVVRRQREDVFPVVATRIARAQAQVRSRAEDYRALYDVRQVRDQVFEQLVRQDQRTEITPKVTTTQRTKTAQRETTVEIPREFQIITEIPAITKTGGFWPPGGGDVGGGRGKGRYAYRETIPLESVLFGESAPAPAARARTVSLNRLYRRTIDLGTGKIGRRYYGHIADEKTIVSRTLAIFKKTKAPRY